MITINITFGELFDRLSILEVKRERIKDRSKLEMVENEYAQLQSKLSGPHAAANNFDYDTNERLWQLMDTLFLTNLTLWDVENELRIYESMGTFDEHFIEAARSVYKLNDKRYNIKCQINNLYGERNIEVKELPKYGD
jgi:hypothetical protein